MGRRNRHRMKPTKRDANSTPMQTQNGISFVAPKNVVNSATSNEVSKNDMDELSAYEALSLKKPVGANMKPLNVAEDKKENRVGKGVVMEKNVLPCNEVSKTDDKSDDKNRKKLRQESRLRMKRKYEVSSLNENVETNIKPRTVIEDETKIPDDRDHVIEKDVFSFNGTSQNDNYSEHKNRGNLRKKINLKRKGNHKIVDEGKSNSPTKVFGDSNKSVFTLLFSERNDNVEDFGHVKKQDTLGEVLQSGKKRKKRKEITDGDLKKNEQKRDRDLIISDSEQYVTNNDEDKSKDEKDKKELELHNNGSFLSVKCGQEAKIDFEKMPFSASEDSTENGLNAFKWLIHPFGMKKFFKMVFQKKELHVCHNNLKYYGNLFSTTKFIDILQMEYIEYGTNVNVAVYKDQKRYTLNGVGKVYPYSIKNSLLDGHSIQFTNPQSFCDSIWYYCDLLQEVFGSFVGANTYLTPPNSAGFAPHWDDIDAFLLQLEGRKYWKIYKPVEEDEMLPRVPSDNFTDDDMTDRTLVFDGWLEQGDLLYIPRGFIHQGFADESIHSLHLTISVGRNITYADLLEEIVPPAISIFANKQVDIRKSLPLRYLDMTGVLDCNYVIGAEAVRHAFLKLLSELLIYVMTKKDFHLQKYFLLLLNRDLSLASSNFCNFLKNLNETAVDIMAREFMRTALPPMLTTEEKNMTALYIDGSSLYKRSELTFTEFTMIKLLRRHGQRLIYESEERCFIVHRMANSRVYEGRPEFVGGFVSLLNSYPKWCSISDLKCDTAAENIELAELLFSNGLIMAKFGKTVW